MRKWIGLSVVALSFVVGGCGVINRMTDWTINDGEKKKRAWDGSSFVTTTHSKGVAGMYVLESESTDGPDWAARGYAEDHQDNVEYSNGFRYTSRYFWNGRHVTFFRPPANQSRGGVESEGWMDTQGLQTGTGGMVISAPFKLGDWRTYNEDSQVLTEGGYIDVRSKKNELVIESAKDGVWKLYDHQAKSVKTETYEKGRLLSRGSEAWPDFSAFAGRYRIEYDKNVVGEFSVDKNGHIVMEQGSSIHPAGRKFGLHRSSFFNGDVTVVNLGWVGSMSRVNIVEGNLVLERYWAWEYPYAKDDKKAPIICTRL